MSTVDNAQLDKMLSDAFAAASALYKERGFQRRVGWGKKPALVSVDLANAWTRPGNPFTCDQDKMDNEIIPGMQKLLKAFRAAHLPVVHVTTAYEITDRNARINSSNLSAKVCTSLWVGGLVTTMPRVLTLLEFALVLAMAESSAAWVTSPGGPWGRPGASWAVAGWVLAPAQALRPGPGA